MSGLSVACRTDLSDAPPMFSGEIGGRSVFLGGDSMGTRPLVAALCPDLLGEVVMGIGGGRWWPCGVGGERMGPARGRNGRIAEVCED